MRVRSPPLAPGVQRGQRVVGRQGNIRQMVQEPCPDRCPQRSNAIRYQPVCRSCSCMSPRRGRPVYEVRPRPGVSLDPWDVPCASARHGAKQGFLCLSEIAQGPEENTLDRESSYSGYCSRISALISSARGWAPKGSSGFPLTKKPGVLRTPSASASARS